MIARAAVHGVSEEKIAQDLDVQVKSIILKENPMDGVCMETEEIFKDKMASNPVFPVLRKMTVTRQIEVGKLMNDSGIYTCSYRLSLVVVVMRIIFRTWFPQSAISSAYLYKYHRHCNPRILWLQKIP